MDLIFAITDSAKRTARRRRMWREAKWRPLRIMLIVLSCIFVAVVSIACITVHQDTARPDSAIGVLLSVMFVCVNTVLLYSLSSVKIQDRKHEKMRMNEYMLVHMWRSTNQVENLVMDDPVGIQYQFDVRTIHDVTYDPVSKRVEFSADGIETMYYGLHDRAVECEFHNYRHVCYDYMAPSLIQMFRERGIVCVEQQIEFSWLEG